MRLRTSTRSVVARFRDRKGGVAIEPFRRPEVTLHVDVDNEVALALLGLGEVLERVRLPGAAPAVDDAVAARPQRTDEGAFLDVSVEDVRVAEAVGAQLDLLDSFQEIRGFHVAVPLLRRLRDLPDTSSRR
jgi:hypothetical protein